MVPRILNLGTERSGLPDAVHPLSIEESGWLAESIWKHCRR